MYLWDAYTGHVLRKLIGHKDTIYSVQFLPNGKYALTTSWNGGGVDYCVPSNDTSTRLWDLETGKQMWTHDGELAGPLTVDGTRVSAVTGLISHTCNSHTRLAVVEIPSGRETQQSSVLDDPSTDRMAFSHDGKRLFRDGVVTNTADGRELFQIPSFRSFSFYGDHGEVVTFGANGLEVWNDAGKRVHQYSVVNPVKYGIGAQWLNDGRQVLSTGWDERRWKAKTPCLIKIWDIESGEVREARLCAEYQLSSLVSPDGKRFLLLERSEKRP